MGNQIFPTPNPAGAIYTVGDGDYNEEIYQNLGTLVSNGLLTVQSPEKGQKSELNNIEGGTIKNSGTLTIGYNGLLNNDKSSALYNSGAINIMALLDGWPQDSWYAEMSNSGTIYNDGIVYNMGNLTNYGMLINNNVLQNNSQSFPFWNEGTLENKGGTINNQGMLISTEGGKIYLYDSSTLNNIDSGLLIMNSRLDIDASSTLNNLSFLKISGDEVVSTLDNNGGTINNKCGETPPGVDDIFWGLRVSAGKLNINNGGKLYNYGSSTIQIGIEGSDRQSELSVYDDGKLCNYDSSTLNNTGNLNINNSSLDNYDSSTLNNSGTLNMVNNSTLDNYDSSTLNNSGTLNINNNSAVVNNTFSTINNDGIINNANNDLGESGFSNNGTYQGSGKILGSWQDYGTVKPGNSSAAARMLVDGNYYKKGGSTEIELGGTLGGWWKFAEFDRIEITGDLELAGDLRVLAINYFQLSAGDSFVITRVDGDLDGQYDGLNEGDSVGSFESDNSGILELFITYKGGDGNDIALYTQSLSGVLPESLREPRIIGSDADDSLTGTSADEVIFGGSGDDVLLGGGGDDQVTGGNGDDRLYGGFGDDILKGDRGADTYRLSRGNDVIIAFSFAENDRISVANGVDLSFKQVGDDLLITADGIHTTLKDVDKGEFLAADVIDFI
ncbi:hypothetical protein [Prochlorococcus sp. MIT 1303]|uniref:hypothetical protein n=1 Tax=Prochlorococcus sp. MIT 1303 TaxID=1723647 RepID=UPI0007B3565F|nr:hypothetical protein [Prochlorococcus sp. MIT 1303]KZR62335.1 Poly(beta-D-mannuronate) C5 epimerase 7 [Prochlorococcus sp. MIT 1303]